VTTLTAAILAMISAAALVPAVRWMASRVGCVASPAGDRWHRRPTPLLGGVAIAVPVIGGMILSGHAWDHGALVASAGLIALVGLVDDVIALSPTTKLVAQIALASLLLLMGYRLHWVESMTLDSVLTLFWIVGITNAFNLLDNMDGLCGGITLIAGTAFMVGAGVQSLETLQGGLYLPLLLGAVAGFMFYNIHPASIFMGDTGSLFLGMSFAGMTLGTGVSAGGAERSLLSVMAAPVLILMIPILDTTLVTISRLLSGRSASQGGRDHSSHRLVAIGLSERRAVMVLWGLAVLAGVSGFLVLSVDTGSSLLIVATMLVTVTVFSVYLLKVRVYEGRDLHLLLRSPRITPLVSTFVYRRRIAEVLLDACLIPIAYYGAYRLRFEGDQLPLNFSNFVQSLPVVVFSQMVALFALGAYRGVWQYFSLIDGVTFGKAAIVGTVIAEVIVLYLFRFESYSRTVFIIYAALVFILLAASRASFRLLDEFASRQRQLGQRLVVYGAGPGGSLAARTIANVDRSYRMLGFIDDDPNKQQLRVQGYPVIGTFERLQQLIEEQKIDAVLISSDPIDADRLALVEELGARNRVQFLQLRVSIDFREAVVHEPRAPGERNAPPLLDPATPSAPGVH
jgi:UDP-GlcNAc:undecaprenyl-phosphate GlcNAc-1-phosphate transferase